MFAICTGLLLAYKLNKRVTIEMADELAERRRKPPPEKPMKHLYLTGFLGIVLATTVWAQTTLKEAFQNDFLIGAALNPAQFCESNATEAALVKRQFNSISPENVLKWESDPSRTRPV